MPGRLCLLPCCPHVLTASHPVHHQVCCWSLHTSAHIVLRQRSCFFFFFVSWLSWCTALQHAGSVLRIDLTVSAMLRGGICNAARHVQPVLCWQGRPRLQATAQTPRDGIPIPLLIGVFTHACAHRQLLLHSLRASIHAARQAQLRCAFVCCSRSSSSGRTAALLACMAIRLEASSHQYLQSCSHQYLQSCRMQCMCVRVSCSSGGAAVDGCSTSSVGRSRRGAAMAARCHWEVATGHSHRAVLAAACDVLWVAVQQLREAAIQ